MVSLAENIQTKEQVAIKKIKKKYSSWDECVNLREVKSLRKLNHQNIVKLKEALKDNDELFLIFEYAETNVLKMYQTVKNEGSRFPESNIKRIIYETCSGLAYMHKNGFFHRDMKPENLLVTSKNVVKIADFGLAREIRSLPPYTDYISTLWYRAPENLLRSTNYTSAIDIFSLGCIMVVCFHQAELYLLDALFKGANEQDQLNKIIAVLGTPPTSWDAGYKLAKKIGIHFGQYNRVPLESIIRNASPEGIDLMNQMLQYDPAKRPTATQILAHPYFSRALKSSGGNGQAPQVWGEQSTRENYLKKKSVIHKYENPKDKVVNIQNHAGNHKMRDLDNDWEDDFDELMKPSNNYKPIHSNKSTMKPIEEASMGNSSRAYNNKSDVYMQNSNYNLKNDAYSNVKQQGHLWEEPGKLDESFEADFDVFDKKGAAKGNSNPFALKSNQNSIGGAKLLDEKKHEGSKHAAFDVGWADEF